MKPASAGLSRTPYVTKAYGHPPELLPYRTGAMQDLPFALLRTLLLERSNKARRRLRQNPTGCQKGPFGSFRSPYVTQIHGGALRESLFGQFLGEVRGVSPF